MNHLKLTWQMHESRFAYQESLFTLRISLLIFYFSCLLFTSCHSDKPDISSIEVDMGVQRFEKDLFSLTPVNYKTGVDSLQKKYPELFPFYFEEIIGLKVKDDSTDSWKDSIWQYIQSSYLKTLYDSTMTRFNDIAS